jgi:Tail tubular protein
MGQQITNLAPTTETEAVNAMLSAIGEAPVADASTATQADVAMAYNLLKWTTRELQSVPWRFNSEDGVEIAATAQVTWADSLGQLTLLNVFKLPTGLHQWRLTPCRQNGDLDLVERPGKQYTETGVAVPILYDRTRNRDGADAVTYPLVYIDVLYAFNFEVMPETARRYATVVAGRRFTQQVLGSDTLAGFQGKDEQLALRSLRRDQGVAEDLNMLDTADAVMITGGRPRLFGGFMQIVYAGPNPVPVIPRTSDMGSLADIRVLDG